VSFSVGWNVCPQANQISSFINKHIFPGGHLPCITQLLNHISTESKGTLVVERVENIGGHYAKALRLWKEKFMENFDSKIRPALKMDHPNMTQEDVEVFQRKWEVSCLNHPLIK
jgi:cyclopropane-fatty-acyl-phospholipid synthase